MTVLRYTDGGPEGWMQSPTGEFVRYEDYERLRAALQQIADFPPGDLRPLADEVKIWRIATDALKAHENEPSVRQHEPEGSLTLDGLAGLIAEADKYILPVDVKIGAATFRRGVKVGTMLRGLRTHAERQIAETSPIKPNDAL